MSGDFFQEIPQGADAHLLKSVIHDWDDAASITILENCRRALPQAGRMLLVERILPARAADSPDDILSDVHMLAMTGGRERTAQQYADLFAAAGFELRRVIPTADGMSILEAGKTN
jgi:hypothetical protein